MCGPSGGKLTFLPRILERDVANQHFVLPYVNTDDMLTNAENYIEVIKQIGAAMNRLRTEFC
jgi:hypothetical protein